MGANWDSQFESKPTTAEMAGGGAEAIRVTRQEARAVVQVEHEFDTAKPLRQGLHAAGSAMALVAASMPANRAGGTGLSEADSVDDGMLVVLTADVGNYKKGLYVRAYNKGKTDTPHWIRIQDIDVIEEAVADAGVTVGGVAFSVGGKTNSAKRGRMTSSGKFDFTGERAGVGAGANLLTGDLKLGNKLTVGGAAGADSDIALAVSKGGVQASFYLFGAKPDTPPNGAMWME